MVAVKNGAAIGVDFWVWMGKIWLGRVLDYLAGLVFRDMIWVGLGIFFSLNMIVFKTGFLVLKTKIVFCLINTKICIHAQHDFLGCV